MSHQYGPGRGPHGQGSSWGNSNAGRGDDKLGSASPSRYLGSPPGFSGQEGSQRNSLLGETSSLPSAQGTSASSVSNESQGTYYPSSTQHHSLPNPNPQAFHGLQPKATLAGWFGKTHRQLISKNDYHTWHDGGMPHQLKFTAVFVSPVTGEVWPCGRYGDPSNYCIRHDPRTNVDVIWYTKKTFAEHAAAARAYDCFIFRETGGRNTMTPRIVEEPPYMSPQEAPPLPTLPLPVETKIVNLHSRLLGQTNPQGQSIRTASVEQVVIDNEAQQFREDYRSMRAPNQGPRHSEKKRKHDMDTL